MVTVYVALSLTHVRTDAEKDEIRAFLKWLEATFEVKIIMWAFDVETWTPKPVDDIYEFDGKCLGEADLAIFLYLTNEGSDGRGGEAVLRRATGKSTLAFKKPGVKVSRFAVDCLKQLGVTAAEFQTFDDMRPAIAAAVGEIARDHSSQAMLALTS